MKERDYLKKRQEIEQQCRNDLAALDRVWAMFSKASPPASTEPLPRVPWPRARVAEEIDDNSPNKRDAVRAALSSFAGREFMSKDVRDKLDTEHPEVSRVITENQLSSIVSRLASMGEIIVVRAKVGRSPAIYALKHPPSEIVQPS
jgi:hypothetical protein